MAPEQGHTSGGQVQYVVMPSLQAPPPLKGQSMSSPGWPGSPGGKQGHMRPVSHGNLQLNSMQARPSQQRLDQQTLMMDGSRLFVTDSFLGPPLGQVNQPYDQAAIPQDGAVPVIQRQPTGTRLHSRPSAVVTSTSHLASPPPVDADLGASSTPALRSELAGKRDQQGGVVAAPLNEGSASFPDGKGEALFSADDELSLSTTLFNMSLDHAAMGGFSADLSARSDDGRAGTDGAGSGVPRAAALQHRAFPDPRHLKTSAYPSPGVSLRGAYPDSDRTMQSGLGGSGIGAMGMGSTSLQLDPRQVRIGDSYRQPKLDLTSSVTDLLFSPAELATGIGLVSKTSRVRLVRGANVRQAAHLLLCSRVHVELLG